MGAGDRRRLDRLRRGLDFAPLGDEVGEVLAGEHARHPDLLDYAERSSDGVGYYVRCLAELLLRPAERSGPPQGQREL